jgi:hypothetical protein
MQRSPIVPGQPRTNARHCSRPWVSRRHLPKKDKLDERRKLSRWNAGGPWTDGWKLATGTGARGRAG